MWCSTCRKLRVMEEQEGLSPSQRSGLEKHLTRCPRCREAHRQEQRLRELLGTAAARGSARDLWPGVAARVGGRRPGPEPTGRRWRPAAVVATLATAAGLVVALMGLPSSSNDESAWVDPLVGNPTVGRMVDEDPWAGDVARALDRVLSGGTGRSNRSGL